MSKRFPFLLGREKSHIWEIPRYGSISVSVSMASYGGGFGGFPPQYRDRSKKKKRMWDGIFPKVFACGNFGERFISLGGGRKRKEIKLFLEIIFCCPVKNLVLPLLLTFLNFVRSKKKWKYYKK